MREKAGAEGLGCDVERAGDGGGAAGLLEYSAAFVADGGIDGGKRAGGEAIGSETAEVGSDDEGGAGVVGAGGLIECCPAALGYYFEVGGDGISALGEGYFGAGESVEIESGVLGGGVGDVEVNGWGGGAGGGFGGGGGGGVGGGGGAGGGRGFLRSRAGSIQLKRSWVSLAAP